MYVSTNTQQPFVAAVWKCLSLADVYMYVCTHTYIRIYLYILYIFIYVYKHTYMCVHTYIYIYTYICVHIYIYPRIYEDCSRFSGPTFVYRHCSLNKDITFFFFSPSIRSWRKLMHILHLSESLCKTRCQHVSPYLQIFHNLCGLQSVISLWHRAFFLFFYFFYF